MKNTTFVAKGEPIKINVAVFFYRYVTVRGAMHFVTFPLCFYYVNRSATRSRIVRRVELT